MQIKIIKIIFLIAILAGAVHFLTAETALSAEQPDFNIIIGEWVRTDGGYRQYQSVRNEKDEQHQKQPF